MNKQPAHIKLIALVLLVVFSIGSAPKAWFHDLFAHHKDMVPCSIVHHKAAMHQEGFNCHCQELVVTGHFLAWTDPATILLPLHEIREASFQVNSPLPGHFHFHDSRGPPAS